IRAARRHVRNLGALLDVRLLVVGGHDARARDYLAARIRFERGELEVDEIAAAEVDERQRELSRSAEDRKVHVELRAVRVTGRCDSGRELERRLRPRVANEPVALQVNDGLRVEAAALADRVFIEREARLGAEAHAKLIAELVARNNDARFNHHLANRRIELADDLAHFLEARRRVGHEENVGAWIDERDAPPGQDRALPAGRARLARAGAKLLLPVRRNDPLEIRRLDVIQLERFEHQRLERADLLRVLELLLFLERKLLARRDQNDVALLAHVEALGLHDDVERLIPRNVLEAQRQAARHRVAGDDVEAREVG